MKKSLLLGMAICALGTYSVKAQNIDLEAVVDMQSGVSLCKGKFFTPNSSTTAADSVFGIYGIVFNGPDGTFEGDKVTFRSSMSHFLTEAEAAAQNPPVPFADRYAWYSIMTLNANNVSNGGFAFSFDAIDSIGMLVDWARYEQYGTDSLRFLGPPHETFVDGQAYGFFARTWGMGESANTIVNTDADMANNIKVVKIIWNSNCGVGIRDLIAPKNKTALQVYPNPAMGEVTIAHNFEKNTNGEVYVRDLTGRTVKNVNLGHIKAGSNTYKVDISGIAAGVYTIELSTGTESAVSKITIK